MSAIEKLDKRYADALRAKSELALAVAELVAAAKECHSDRDAITQRAHKEHPEIFDKMLEGYTNGERIKDAMQKGRRWPEAKKSTYLESLESIPIEQRSPELSECLKWWRQFGDALAQIEKLYPAPQYFWWNGPNLAGPNMYQDFGISESM